LIVLELSGAAISSVSSFLEVDNLFPLFGMSLTLN
jgi:hypothetical protein